MASILSIRRNRLQQAAKAGRKQAERAARLGRRRANALTDRVPDLREELVQEVVDDVRRRAEPLVDRALNRRRPRRRGFMAVAVVLLLAAAAVAYWMWQRREKHPAYLVEQPDEPSTTPGSKAPEPEPATPNGQHGGGPAAPSERTPASASTPRESAALHAEAPSATTRPAARPAGPVFPPAAAPFAAAKDRLPASGFRPFTSR